MRHEQQHDAPPPCVFGVGEKFNNWRPDQFNVVTSITDSANRYIMPICPTGFGKSLTYTVASLIDGGRSIILTSTKALQDQLVRDFPGIIVDIRGKDNYKCKLMGGYATCGYGPCNFGVRCGFQKGGCEYYDRVRLALQSKVVVTNYAYWFNQKGWGGAAGGYEHQFSMVICDEAHELPEALSTFLTHEIKRNKKDDGHIVNRIVDSFPDQHPAEIEAWVKRSIGAVVPELEARVEHIKGGGAGQSEMKDTKVLKSLHEALVFINRAWTADPGNIVIYRTGVGKDTITASLVWPYDFTESVLCKSVAKIVFTSATVTPKTLSLLGIDTSEVHQMEVDHPFPLENRMLTHINTCRLNFRSPPADIQRWLMRIDQIIKPRLDRKGIVHTVSYSRQKQVMEASKLVEHMITHDSRGTNDTVAAFKLNPDPGVLVSPVLTTGYDFPGGECRYQIIGKIAYPDVSDPVIKRRLTMDPDYASYIAMQRLIQTCGRGVRSHDDWCENFVIDDNVKWFMDKYKKFAPKWFRRSVQFAGNTIPRPRSIENT